MLCDKAVLEKLSSADAYDELMAPFFPPPNLLLADPPAHGSMRVRWEKRIASIGSRGLASTIQQHFRTIPPGSVVDLYESMKTLSWKLLLNIFLAVADDNTKDAEFTEKLISLQEDLLRGQFSLFPVSINTRFWTSPRAKGIAAREKLQSLLRDRLRSHPSSFPFAFSDEEELNDIADHLLLFTSSLAAKALASLLTAVMLNVYHDHPDHGKLINRIRGLSDPRAREALIKSLVCETERLSPPVIGIMRRATTDIILPPSNKDVQSTLIPQGWDIWLYFVGAARDPAVFDATAQVFQADRYSANNVGDQHGFAFGAGPKACLGHNAMRDLIIELVKVCAGVEGNGGNGDHDGDGVELRVSEGREVPLGVQGWLGWCSNVKPEDWARDMKQLPTQRPVKPIMVTFHP